MLTAVWTSDCPTLVIIGLPLVRRKMMTATLPSCRLTRCVSSAWTKTDPIRLRLTPPNNSLRLKFVLSNAQMVLQSMAIHGLYFQFTGRDLRICVKKEGEGRMERPRALCVSKVLVDGTPMVNKSHATIKDMP